MGVKGLLPIIKNFAPSSIKKKEFKDYIGTVQALDAPIIIYKFTIATINTDMNKNGHLHACFFKSRSLLGYGMIPLWVFDGPPPEIKKQTLIDRRKFKESALYKISNTNLSNNEKYKLIKNSITVNIKQLEEVKFLISLLGLPYIESPEEAEAQCAALNIANVSNGVVTEDWDALLFGCKIMLKDFSNKTIVTEINGEELLRSLAITREQLIDLATILGNDYCHGIGGLKPIDAFIKFKEHDCNMTLFLEYINNENNNYGYFKYKIPEKFNQQWLEAREYYLHAPVINPKNIKPIWKKPNYVELEKYLIEVKKFNREEIMNKIMELRLMYDKYILNGNELVTFTRIKNELKNSHSCEFVCDNESGSFSNNPIMSLINIKNQKNIANVINPKNLHNIFLEMINEVIPIKG